MKLISWNVNSIRVRYPLVVDLIKAHQPDILFLQETKCLPEQFPLEVFEDLGYNIEHVGQRAFNGVAILSKMPFEGKSIEKIPNLESDHARYIEVFINGHLFINVYVPNGQDPSSDKYVYKLHFLDCLYEHLKMYVKQHIPFILGGDFNIALTAEDTSFPDENSICFTIQERQRLNQIINLGLIDIQSYKKISGFTWWNYIGRGFEKNQGMRLDYMFITPSLVPSLKSFFVDTDTRVQPRTSDHAPLVVTFDDRFLG